MSTQQPLQQSSQQQQQQQQQQLAGSASPYMNITQLAQLPGLVCAPLGTFLQNPPPGTGATQSDSSNKKGAGKCVVSVCMCVCAYMKGVRHVCHLLVYSMTVNLPLNSFPSFFVFFQAQDISSLKRRSESSHVESESHKRARLTDPTPQSPSLVSSSSSSSTLSSSSSSSSPHPNTPMSAFQPKSHPQQRSPVIKVIPYTPSQGEPILSL